MRLPDKVNMGGVTVQLVSDEEAEKSSMVVCVPDTDVTPFSDKVKTTCAFCGRGIQHRPHAPKGPPKVCLKCVMETNSDTARTMTASRDHVHSILRGDSGEN